MRIYDISEKRPVERDFANLTDYSQICSDGARKFFAFIHFFVDGKATGDR